MEKKQNLNIIIADGSSSEKYVQYLNKYFNVNVLKHDDIKNYPDLILFTGGADVNPNLYNENVGKFTTFNEKRDQIEQDIYWKYINTPKLGICRGNQFLTVMAGGKLIQHVTGHTSNHLITIKDFGNIEVTSTHHQMIYPFDMHPKDYDLIGYSTNFRSDTYLNGNDEETILDKDFLEPEIVEYYNNKSLCIQGHPEFGSEQFQNVTLDLISKFLDKFKTKKLDYKKFNIGSDSIPHFWGDKIHIKPPTQKTGKPSYTVYDSASISYDPFSPFSDAGVQRMYGTKTSGIGINEQIYISSYNQITEKDLETIIDPLTRRVRRK